MKTGWRSGVIVRKWMKGSRAASAADHSPAPLLGGSLPRLTTAPEMSLKLKESVLRGRRLWNWPGRLDPASWPSAVSAAPTLQPSGSSVLGTGTLQGKPPAHTPRDRHPDPGMDPGSFLMCSISLRNRHPRDRRRNPERQNRLRNQYRASYAAGS